MKVGSCDIRQKRDPQKLRRRTKSLEEHKSTISLAEERITARVASNVWCIGDCGLMSEALQAAIETKLAT